jgi:hypothetical protein
LHEAGFMNMWTKLIGYDLPANGSVARWALARDKHFSVPRFHYRSVNLWKWTCFSRVYVTVNVNNPAHENENRHKSRFLTFAGNSVYCPLYHVYRNILHHARICAAGVSSGPATMMVLVRLSRQMLGESVTRRWTSLWFHFYRSTWLLCCVWNGTLCKSWHTSGPVFIILVPYANRIETETGLILAVGYWHPREMECTMYTALGSSMLKFSPVTQNKTLIEHLVTSLQIFVSCNVPFANILWHVKSGVALL